ncbi:M56 family metallopeptidase [Streptomyces sp. NPDC020766]|uniref:M56 family metallopeptidase n=1 Tax=Streptomyces sp. NPDC020766 TaxID=3155011 RepID=UPI00340958CD
MIRLTLLAGYLVVCATWVPWMLSRAVWVSRFPRAAIALWAGLVVAVSAGAVAFGAMTARHVRWHAADLVWGWTRLLDALGGHLAVILCVAGALSAAVVVLRGVIVGTGSLWHLRKGWRDHVDALDLLARPLEDLPAVVLEHTVPAAYCVPTKGGRVVLTSGALRRLPPGTVAAVMAHEQAHLRGRHHLMAALAASLARAFPYVPLFRLVRPAMTRLIELAADDHASRRCRTESVATALSVLVAMPLGAGALQAGAEGAGERIRRLHRTPASGRRQSVAAVGGFLATVASSALVATWAWAGGC